MTGFVSHNRSSEGVACLPKAGHLHELTCQDALSRSSKLAHSPDEMATARARHVLRRSTGTTPAPQISRRFAGLDRALGASAPHDEALQHWPHVRSSTRSSSVCSLHLTPNSAARAVSSDHNPVAVPQEVLEENILVKLLSTSLPHLFCDPSPSLLRPSGSAFRVSLLYNAKRVLLQNDLLVLLRGICSRHGKDMGMAGPFEDCGSATFSANT